jgi:uridine phosphorylase
MVWQGRVDAHFEDQAEGLLARLLEAQPDVASMEMESFMLLDLARCSKGSVRAAATAIVVANRPTGGVVDGATLARVESFGGRAVLQALASHPLE